MEQYLLRGCGGDEMSFYQFERFTPKTVQEKRPCHTLRKGRTCINIFFQYFLDLEAGRRVIGSFLSQGLFWAETRKALSDQGVERAAPLPSLSEPGPHHLCPWRWHPRPAAPAFLCQRDSSGLRRPVGHWNGSSPSSSHTSESSPRPKDSVGIPTSSEGITARHFVHWLPECSGKHHPSVTYGGLCLDDTTFFPRSSPLSRYFLVPRPK